MTFAYGPASQLLCTAVHNRRLTSWSRAPSPYPMGGPGPGIYALIPRPISLNHSIIHVPHRPSPLQRAAGLLIRCSVVPACRRWQQQ